MPGSTPAGGQITPLDWDSSWLRFALPVVSLERGTGFATSGGQSRRSVGNGAGPVDGFVCASVAADKDIVAAKAIASFSNRVIFLHSLVGNRSTESDCSGSAQGDNRSANLPTTGFIARKLRERIDVKRYRFGYLPPAPDPGANRSAELMGPSDIGSVGAGQRSVHRHKMNFVPGANSIHAPLTTGKAS